MAVHVFGSENCPRCGGVIKAYRGGSYSSEQLKWGSPIEKCKTCGMFVLTGRKYYKIMSPVGRINWIISRVFGFALYFVGAGCLIFGGVASQFLSDRAAIQLAVLGGVIGAIFCIHFLAKDLPRKMNWEPDRELIDAYERLVLGRIPKNKE